MEISKEFYSIHFKIAYVTSQKKSSAFAQWLNRACQFGNLTVSYQSYSCNQEILFPRPVTSTVYTLNTGVSRLPTALYEQG